MFGLYRHFQQLHVHDPDLKLRLLDTFTKSTLSYCCEIWSIWGSKSSRDDLKRTELSFLKQLLGVQVHTNLALQNLAAIPCDGSGWTRQLNMLDT